MSFWKCNIQREGRLLRLAGGIFLLIAAVLLYLQGFIWWVPVLAALAGFSSCSKRRAAGACCAPSG